MPARSIVRRPTVVPSISAATGANAIGTSAPIYVDSDDDALKYIPAGTGSTERAVAVSLSTSGFRFTAGTGTCVSGTVVVATGLATVLGFVATLEGTGATATGATEIDTLFVSSITTGAVTVAGSYHSATAAVQVVSTASSSTFRWFALGT